GDAGAELSSAGGAVWRENPRPADLAPIDGPAKTAFFTTGAEALSDTFPANSVKNIFDLPFSEGLIRRLHHRQLSAICGR
ncbi:hypothetical protein FK513_30565, partial [Klebsiella pneumoniae]|nr:hypothetical protein [Klebsiella pneumoniae]